jgi:hypothetical protein
MNGQLKSMAAYCMRLFWLFDISSWKKQEHASLTIDTEGLTEVINFRLLSLAPFQLQMFPDAERK